MMQLDKYQQKVLDTYRTTNKNIFVNATAGCLGKDVPVLMFDGSMKMSQDIVVGDVLMGPDSTPRNVLVTQRGHSNMYRIVPVKGMEWTCNDSHIMVVHDNIRGTVNMGMDDVLKYEESDGFIRKLRLIRQSKEGALYVEFAVYDIGMGDWYGFTVDGDNRYLLGDFTITHNSGKTTTLVQLANATPPAKKAIFLAFNKSIANELSSRLPNTVKASTLHSCGLSAFLKAYRCDMTVNDAKYFRMAKDSLDWKGVHPKRIPGLCAKICRIYDLMRFNLVSPAVPDIMTLAERYGEDINEDIANRAIQLHVMDSRTMEQYLNDGCKGRLVMDYTDMLYYTVKYLEDSDMKHYNVVMLDESQDISPLQYSLVKKLRTPHGRTVAVGDAKQSIYSFMGSNLDSLHEIQNAPNTVTLPLSVTYRCAMDIVDEAAKVFPGEIFAAPNAAKGSVTYGEYINAANGDYIVCRNNAPLVEVFLKLIKKGKKCTILGKELGEQLVEMIDSVNSIYDFERILDNVIKKLSSKGVDNPIKTEIYAKMDERVTILLDLYDYFGDLNTVRNRIHDIFVADADNTGITLSTIHKSKGLEARNVYFLCPELLPSKFARTELELYAEKCLQFVGITRAKENLIYCTK